MPKLLPLHNCQFHSVCEVITGRLGHGGVEFSSSMLPLCYAGESSSKPCTVWATVERGEVGPTLRVLH